MRIPLFPRSNPLTPALSPLGRGEGVGAVSRCTPTGPGQGHCQSSRKWLAGLQPAIQQTGNPLDRDLVTGSATGYKKRAGGKTLRHLFKLILSYSAN